MAPVYDHVIATEPLTEQQWVEIGWRTQVGVGDAGNQFHYYRTTPDGRIVFGGWDATYHRGGRVEDRLEQSEATHTLLVEHLLQTLPALAGIRISHRWGGPIDTTTRFTPTAAADAPLRPTARRPRRRTGHVRRLRWRPTAR